MSKPSIIRRLLMCIPGFCGMVSAGDEDYVWGQCPRCGKRAGVCSREAIRRYIEAEAIATEARERLAAEKRRILDGARQQ